MGGTTLTIGERIRLERESHHMTLDELSKKIGIQRASINKYEMGRVIPLLKRMEQFAAALNVSPAYLAGWSDK